MARPTVGSLEDAQLQFVCDPAKRLFPLAIDEVAFAERVIATTTDPRALHDAMAKDPRVPIVRSSAPDTRTFGTIQTVKRGEAMVPPRDYHKGSQVPRSADYDADTVGVIYDVAYLGIKEGEIAFEIRGYSGDDMVHPGSGQTETSPIGPSPIGVKTTNIRDLAFTIIKATPDAITYRVKIEKQAPVEVDDCTAGGCDELLTVEAEVPTPAKRPRRK